MLPIVAQIISDQLIEVPKTSKERHATIGSLKSTNGVSHGLQGGNAQSADPAAEGT
jgi:hypothetical protein